jgi:serine/threonine protein kinase
MGTASSLNLPHRFGNYILHDELGKGAFGRVFKATSFFNKRVALKIFEPDRHMIGEREIKYLKKIAGTKCPALCLMQTHVEVHRHIAISFELLYKSVYDIQRENDFRPYRDVTIHIITRGVLRGLSALHAINIAHSDLKPENIMFCNDMCDSVKIIDFGLARGSPCGQATYAQSRYYRAPEVVLGVGSDILIDMWSLGTILPELATGAPLFKARSEEHLLAFHMGVHGEIPFTMLARTVRSKAFFNAVGRALPSDIPSPLTAYGDFVHKCLMVNPAERMGANDALQHSFITEYESSHGQHFGGNDISDVETAT